jgi:hypothetical protein
VKRSLYVLAVLTALALVALFVTTGCAKRHRLQFESNTCWRAVVDASSTGIIEDCQNASYKVMGDISCVTIQTRTTTDTTHFVRVKIDDGDWSTKAVDGGNQVKICRN